jgi:hypothetical protein
MLSHLYPQQRSLHPKFIQINIVPEGDGESPEEQQLDLFADRTSTQTFESNQLRLWLSAMAYVLMQAFGNIV